MGQEFRKKLRINSGIKFVFYPIVFFLLSALLVVAALGPVLRPYLDMADLVFLQQAPTFNKEAANIYQGPIQDKGGTLKKAEVVFPSEGETFGKIRIASVGIEASLIYGDNIKNMRKGVEVYSGTYLPGEDRTILIGGHNNTHFRTLKNVKTGDKVELQTNYGTYIYEVTGSRIARFDDTSAYDLTRAEENLILYTCYNESKIGATPNRTFVYGKYVSGPKIVS